MNATESTKPMLGTERTGIPASASPRTIVSKRFTAAMAAAARANDPTTSLDKTYKLG